MIKSAKVIIYDNNNKILLLTRSDTHPKYALHLDLPGGIVEENESNEFAIKRECDEEIGVSINIEDLRLVKKVRLPSISRNLFEIYLNHTPEIKLSWEHSEYSWTSEEEIKKMSTTKDFDPYFNMLIEYIKSK